MAATILRRVCQYLDITTEQILSWREVDDEIVIVVDKGIEGCPKLRIRKADLPAQTRRRKQTEARDADS